MYYLTLIVSVLLLMHGFYALALWKRNFSVVDIAWGLGFILISLVTYFFYPLSARSALSMMVVFLWGSRLAFHIFERGRGQPEDFRYHQMREEWGRLANLKAYFIVFLLQGFLMLVISLPIIMGMQQQKWSPTILNWLGLLVWVIGFSFEVKSDSYLKWFKMQKENQGKICMSGPWKLSRFPNYFGEVLLWYGIYFLNVDAHTWWTIIGPVTINFFILKVSGVPLLEKKYQKRPEYIEYSKRVARFVPFTRPTAVSAE